MKKIIGTILAAGLAISAFAAEPAPNFVMTEFKGDASLEFQANFAGVDGVEFGMKNNLTSNIKFGVISEGTKGTTGDGIWGDLQIKFKDGVSWGDVDPLPTTLAKPNIEVAKIHFLDGDFSAALDIKGPDLKRSAYTPVMATPGGISGAGVDATLGGDQGFGLELGMKDLFSFNLDFADNGVKPADEKKYGLAFEAAVTAISPLTANVMGAFNFYNGYTGIGAVASYNLALSDTLYINPGVSFTFNNGKSDATKNSNTENSMDLTAGLMFGWGAKECEPGLDFIGNKTNEGVSVAVSTNMKENGLKLAVGAYDESLFELLGLSDFGKLSLGAQYVMNNITPVKFADNVAKEEQKQIKDILAFAGKYHLDLSPIHFDLHGGMQMYMFDGSDSKVGYKFGVTLGSTEIIDNTDIYVDYQFENDPYVFKVDEGETEKGRYGLSKTNLLKIGTKIQF